MRLILIRHAIARPAEKWSGRDADRPLTAEGRRRFAQVSARMAELEPRPTAILTSPSVRARQTAEIAARAWGDLKPVVSAALVDGDWVNIRKALANYASDATVVLVGHENWLSTMTARLLRSKSPAAFAYRKGGAALIEMKTLRAGPACLRWFIPPRALRRP